MTDSRETMRLQVYLARCGIGSRRKCEKFILDSRISVNNKIITTLGERVSPEDKVCFDKATVNIHLPKIYIALNKPPGFICSDNDPQGRPLAKELITSSISSRIYNVGRLDYKSSGLIFLTNDGNFCKHISHPAQNIEKEYEVSTKHIITPRLLQNFVKGLRIDGVRYKAVSACLSGPRKARIIIHEGKNREIRRVFNSFNLKINSVHRIRIGCVNIQGLSSGKFRHLRQNEIKKLLYCSKRDKSIQNDYNY